ncbi:MAG: spore coat protein U-like protein [Paraglaciecola sp.]|jgi:spore coat protein U-like protein
MKNKFSLLFASSFFALVSTANATTDSGVLEVTTTVGNSCSIDAMARIDFGEYDPSAISTSTTGSSLNVTCNGSTVAWRIHSTQSVATRVMTRVGGAETLSYTLTDSADTAFATADIAAGQAIGTGTGSAIIKGAIAAGQNVVPGTYTQQIALTIMF